MVKRIGIKIIILVAIISIFFPPISTFSTTKQRIFDDANLLTEEEINQLEEFAEKASIKRETDFLILTINIKDGSNLTKYMEDFYDNNGPGFDQKHGNTAILGIDMENRDVELMGFYKAKEYLDNNRFNQIRQKITPHLSAGDYYKAFKLFIETSDQYMETLPIVDSQPQPGTSHKLDPDHVLFKLWFQIVISIAAAMLIVGAMAYNSDGKVTVNHKTYQNVETSKILERRDRYIRTTTTRRRRPQSNSGGGGSGGGGGGRTSGGHSYSGSRGKF